MQNHSYGPYVRNGKNIFDKKNLGKYQHRQKNIGGKLLFWGIFVTFAPVTISYKYIQMLMNVTPTSITAIPMQNAPTHLDHTIVIVLLDMLVMVLHAEVGYISDIIFLVSYNFI